MGLFGTPIPDVRGDMNVGFTPFWDTFLPAYTKKSVILGPKKEKRDYLANLFMAKPDYEEPHKKLFYSAFWGAKFGLCSFICYP